ncbi:hypothetical protein CVT26_005557 [Gymnopilus dilepis]|uniref:Heterokaryon incompatibility domain-containing protein n=1 Tax=Gymnopilus dilepis TaxID=231916 RepID=A0A409WJP7_9AGAR|nr:hypothetical protein CVT26_005557 [Gymnopilus dilepis]
MRLINANTLEMETFPKEVPVYAILSHTWGDEEITFQEMIARNAQPVIELKEGFAKIRKTCEQAVLDGFSFVWIDTCCIDKTSSSELSEAINSMFKWYREAEVCYAYLVDVSASQNAFDFESQFRRCRWFTRGWTLQELLAPLSVVFYDKDWVEIGTKASLRGVITEVTNISKQVLLANHGGEVSIAERMLWAVNRETTRIEDIAYCLLGLFGINMPILYGEGENAFARLQKEIIATSDDHTIFAWLGPGQTAGLLAKSPADFANSLYLSRTVAENKRFPFNITNVGLSIELPLQPAGGDNPNEFRALLDCTWHNINTRACGIYLNKDDDGQYVRTRTNEIFLDDLDNRKNYKRELIYIKEPVPSRFDVSQWMRPRTNYQFLVKTIPNAQSDGFAATQFCKAQNWSQITSSGTTQHRLTLAGSGISGGILFESQSGQYERFVVMLGVHNYNIWCDIVTDIPQSATLETVASSYYEHDGTMLWENRDRLCKKLILYDKYVFVAARKGIQKFEYQFSVNITVSTAAPPNASAGGFGGLDLVIPRAYAAYRFHVVFDRRAWEVVALPSFESIAWQRQTDQSLTLGLKSSGVSGIVVLRDRVSNARLAVLLGVHNYRAWSDLVPNVDSQTGAAEEIRKSYYSGNRNQRLWDWDTDVQAPLTKDLSVRVVTTQPKENTFRSEITRNTSV